jgi:hypothetical protein
VSRLNDDTSETLQQRVLPHELKLYSKVIQLFAEGKIEIKDNKALIKSYRSERKFRYHNRYGRGRPHVVNLSNHDEPRDFKE